MFLRQGQVFGVLQQEVIGFAGFRLHDFQLQFAELGSHLIRMNYPIAFDDDPAFGKVSQRGERDDR